MPTKNTHNQSIPFLAPESTISQTSSPCVHVPRLTNFVLFLAHTHSLPLRHLSSVPKALRSTNSTKSTNNVQLSHYTKFSLFFCTHTLPSLPFASFPPSLGSTISSKYSLLVHSSQHSHTHKAIYNFCSLLVYCVHFQAQYFHFGGEARAFGQHGMPIHYAWCINHNVCYTREKVHILDAMLCTLRQSYWDFPPQFDCPKKLLPWGNFPNRREGIIAYERISDPFDNNFIPHTSVGDRVHVM